METNTQVSPKKTKKIFSFKKKKDFKPIDGESSGYSSGTTSASSTFSYRGKKKNKKTKHQMTPETVLDFDNERRSSSSNSEEKSTTSEDEYKNEVDKDPNVEDKSFKIIGKAMEIPVINDGYTWLSDLTWPYLTKAGTLTLPYLISAKNASLIEKMFPIMENGIKRLEESEKSTAAKEKLFEYADKADQTAVSYLEYLMDNYPVIKTQTYQLKEQIRNLVNQVYFPSYNMPASYIPWNSYNYEVACN